MTYGEAGQVDDHDDDGQDRVLSYAVRVLKWRHHLRKIKFDFV